LLIDCDPGHDDALALILGHHLAEVIGVTTVSGNAPLPAVTDNALAIIDLIGDGTPVHSGAAGPLVAPTDGRPPHALHVHGETGLGGAELQSSVAAPVTDDAASYLLDVSRDSPNAWLVAIGPLTNVALAIQRDPEFVNRLAGISIMGGGRAGGNVTAAAEFNIWADPEAADVVFQSGARIRLCDLNLTHQFKTTESLPARLRQSGTPRALFAAGLLDYLHERMRDLTGEAVAALHDPCAILAAIRPQLLEFQSLPVAVELQGTLTRGMTVVDDRYSSRLVEPRVEVASRIDREAGLALLLDSLEVDG